MKKTNWLLVAALIIGLMATVCFAEEQNRGEDNDNYYACPGPYGGQAGADMGCRAAGTGMAPFGNP